MKNGQRVETYKGGKYVEEPKKMPKHIHGILICQKCRSTWNRAEYRLIQIQCLGLHYLKIRDIYSLN